MEHLQWGWVAWPWGHARLRDCCSVHQRNRRKAFPSGATEKEMSAEEKLYVFNCLNQKYGYALGTRPRQFALLHEISKKQATLRFHLKGNPSTATGKEISAEEKLHVFICVNQKIWLSTGRNRPRQFALLHEISKKASNSLVPFRRHCSINRHTDLIWPYTFFKIWGVSFNWINTFSKKACLLCDCGALYEFWVMLTYLPDNILLHAL